MPTIEATKPINQMMHIFAELSEDAFYSCEVQPDGICRIDWASPAFEQITGLTLQQVNQSGGLVHYIAEPDIASAQEQLALALAGKDDKRILHLVEHDGHLRRVIHRLHPQREGEGGPVVRLYGLLRRLSLEGSNLFNHYRVSEQAIQSETISRANEERLRKLVKAIPDSIAIVDADGICIEYYPGRPESLYLPAEVLQGANLMGYFQENIQSRTISADPSLMIDNYAEFVEIAIPINGVTHLYESHITPFGDGEMLAISRNVTERRHAEHALRNSEERNRALLQAIPDMMFVVDRAGYYVDVHANTLEDLHTSAAMHIGKHTRDVVPPALAERFLAANQRVLDQGSKEIVEYELQFGAETRIFEARIVPCGSDKVLSIVRNVSERKQQEAQLRASEEQNQALFHAIPDLMLLLGVDGEYLSIHCASDVDLFGRREEMIGRNVRDYVTAEEFDRVQMQIESVLQTGEMILYEYSHQFGEELRYFEARIVACGEDKVLFIIRNISERKRTEDKLRLQNALLKAQLDASPEGILVVDQERKWLDVNQQFIDLWNFPAAVIAQSSSVAALKHIQKLVENAPQFLDVVEQTYGDPHRELLDEVQLKDGRTFERRSRPILDIDQHVLGRVWFYRNITQQRSAEALLRAAETEYRKLFENMPIGVYRSLANGQQLRANPALVQLNGYASEKEQITNVHNIATEWYVDPHRREEFKRLLEKDGQVRQFESEIYRHKTRERIWVSEDAVLIRDEAGKTLYYEGTVQDITQRRQSEAAIRRLNEQLQSASRLKDEFLKNISHEFRTPLTIILTLSETVANGRFGTLNEQQASSLQRIQNQGRHLLEMVNNLLDMATLLAGTVELQRGRVSLQDLCTHIIYAAREAAIQKKITITSVIEATVKSIEADERRLGQIVQTLINNAIKFTPEGGMVGVELHENKTKRQVQIIVWDTGIGLQPEDAQKLFQPFVKLDTTLARRHDGAGLGLALAAHLTEMHNGTIIVESQSGQGARFIVTLPDI